MGLPFWPLHCLSRPYHPRPTGPYTTYKPRSCTIVHCNVTMTLRNTIQYIIHLDLAALPSPNGSCTLCRGSGHFGLSRGRTAPRGSYAECQPKPACTRPFISFALFPFDLAWRLPPGGLRHGESVMLCSRKGQLIVSVPILYALVSVVAHCIGSGSSLRI